MIVPGVGPVHNVLVQGVKEEVMDEPDVAWEIWIKTCLILEFLKEELPFCTNA
jgi:hypothetical protein